LYYCIKSQPTESTVHQFLSSRDRWAGKSFRSVEQNARCHLHLHHGLQDLRHPQRPDLWRACQSGALSGLVGLAGILCAGDGVVAPIALLETPSRTLPGIHRVHSLPPRAPNHDDARMQPSRSIEHSIPVAATCNASRSAVEGHTAGSASAGTRPVRRHHHHHYISKLRALTRKSPLHELSIAALRSQESQAVSESSSRSRLCLHDSCKTSFRQRPKVFPAERQPKSKADDRRDQFPPVCLVEAGSWGVGDRPVAAFPTVLARVTTRVSTFGVSRACLDTATIETSMTLWFEEPLAILVELKLGNIATWHFPVPSNHTIDSAALPNKSLSSMPTCLTVANSQKGHTW
jgi:hypothetical protein